MKRLTIQARLAIWYLLTMGLILALFAGGSWMALKASMYHSIDRDLGYRIAPVAQFIHNHQLNSRETFEHAFTNSSDSSIIGVFVQITDEQSRVLYESEVLSSHRTPVMPPAPADGSVRISTAGHRGWPVRVASQRLVVGGEAINLHVAEPLRDLLNSLAEYSTWLAFLIAAALILTTTAGYWMSRRALAPVEEIRKEAEAIDPSDLARRLNVPPAEDELARLARTLNAMLGRIEDSFRAIQRFTADASHELRAPLAMIITAADVSLRKERSREELAETLHKISAEARRMSRLVEELLALARGDAAAAIDELHPVDLCSLIREICSELATAAQAKGLRLSAEFSSQDIQVMGETAELRRLLVILVDNAIKYTEAGAITINAAPDDGFVKFVVSDTGIGIDKDALPRIFDRFWRADKVRSRAAGGAGLGLSLASQIVRKLGGTISVESEPGRGSSFVVQLKCAATQERISPHSDSLQAYRSSPI